MSSTQEVGEIFGEGIGAAQAMLRSPTVLIASVGLWGMNLFFFRLFRLDYRYILNYDLMMEKESAKPEPPVKPDPSGTPTSTDDEYEDDAGDEGHLHPEAKAGSVISSQRLVSLSFLLLFILHVTTYVWMNILGKSSIGAVFGFYAVVLAYIFVPIHSNLWLRKAFVIVLQRSFELINPRCSCVVVTDASGPRPIPFIDVFYADAMCSLSKVFFDWGLLIHQASHYPMPVPPSMHNILIPSACAAVPYIIRARQCLIMHTVGKIKNDPKRYQHILNAIKYSTSIFPLCLSAYQKTVSKEQEKSLEPLLITLLTINALYALCWDIVMDWGMMQNPTAVVAGACVGGSIPGEALSPPTCRAIMLRKRLRFGVLMSSVILLTDIILRFSWMLRFVQDVIFPNSDNFILCTQFLEVFRRAIWNLLRVEWENIKQKAKKEKARLSSHHSGLGDEETTPFISEVSIESIAPVSSDGSHLQARK